MPYQPTASDYEPVTPLRRAFPDEEGADDWPTPKRVSNEDDGSSHAEDSDGVETDGETRRNADARTNESGADANKRRAANKSNGNSDKSVARAWPALRRGHGVAFAGLLLFTAFVYFRPYELLPALAPLSTAAFWIAVATLVVFIPAQLGLEGTLTARPREVNFVLLLLVAALLSIPLAIEPAESWKAWLDFAKVITMFVVMINVVRTERRLRSMIWLALLTGVVLSVNALNDYRTGQFKPGADRIVGVIGGMFENPNDMALFLVTLIPLALGLLFAARGMSKKMLYAAAALLMLLATVVTLSRGGLLALACASFVFAWKVGRRNRALVILSYVAAGALLLILIPPEFTLRLLSIFGGSDADGGSAVARQNLLIRSIFVSLRHPLFGVGMDNFHVLSLREQVSHNAYTQVSADLGVPALAFYVLFMLSALKRLRSVERETFDERRRARVFYVTVGLQAGMVGYMVSSFFASVAYQWYVYYLAGYALCLHRLYEANGANVFSRVARTRALDEGVGDEDGSDAEEDGEVARVVLNEGRAARAGRYGV